MVDSPILKMMYRLDIMRYQFDNAMKAYIEGRISEAIVSKKRDELDELEEEFKNRVLSLEEENRRLKEG